MLRPPLRRLALAASFALAACNHQAADDRDLDLLDNQLIAAGDANATDPMVMSALKSQVMVDPTLAHQANADAVRPPRQPYAGALPADAPVTAGGASAPAGPTAPTPAPNAAGCPQCRAARESLTLGALAARQPDARTRGCAGAMRYSATWADRLPIDLPLYPDARVHEAAGSTDAGCRLRAVSFASAAPPQHVMDWYYARVRHAGYDAAQQRDGNQRVLGGTRATDGSAFALFLTPRHDGGTDIDLIANNGR